MPSLPEITGLDHALECAGNEYDEIAFLYFVGIEHMRADHRRHPLRLLLVTIEQAPGRPIDIPGPVADGLFASLRRALRDTDVIGWYRRDRIAGAILTGPAYVPGHEMSQVIRHRVGDAVHRHLSPAFASHVRVRVIQLRRPSGTT